MQQHHQLSPRKKVFNVQISAGKVTASVFCDLVCGILEERCHNQVRARFVEIKNLKQRTRRFRLQTKIKQDPPARKRLTVNQSEPNGAECSFSPDLAPSNFYPFCPLEDALRARRFADDDELKHIVREEPRRFGKDFFANGIQPLMQRWKHVLIAKSICGRIISTYYST